MSCLLLIKVSAMTAVMSTVVLYKKVAALIFTEAFLCEFACELCTVHFLTDPKTLAFSNSLTDVSKIYLGSIVSVDGCLSLATCQGYTLPSPQDSWNLASTTSVALNAE